MASPNLVKEEGPLVQNNNKKPKSIMCLDFKINDNTFLDINMIWSDTI